MPARFQKHQPGRPLTLHLHPKIMKNQLSDLTIEKIMWRGRGLARLESGKAVIVEPGVLPGEVIKAEVIKDKKDFVQARATEIITPSVLRRPHPCPYAVHCGGCRMGILPASKALELKKNILEDTLIRSLRRCMDIAALPSIRTIASPHGWRYRYRGQIHVRDHQPHFQQLESNDLVRLKDCRLLVRPLAQALTALSAELPDGRFTVAASPKDLTICSEQEPKIITLPFPEYNMELTLPGDSFFQANWELNQTLVHLVVQAVSEHERIADLYAGAGNFSLPLAVCGKTLLAMESAPKAVASGKKNAQRLGITNVSFQAHDLSKNMPWESIKAFGPTALILDPPRCGAKNIATKILNLPTLTTMAWVSCDVVNTCRDIAPLLQAGWAIQQITLLDMFPQTWHMETVFILHKKYPPMP